MIYITGDCHGDWRRFSSDCFPEQKEMTRNDYVIICGDFGLWHCCPQEIATLFSMGCYKPDDLTMYFTNLAHNINFKKWFFGHYHDNQQILNKFVMLYEQIIRIA